MGQRNSRWLGNKTLLWVVSLGRCDEYSFDVGQVCDMDTENYVWAVSITAGEGDVIIIIKEQIKVT